MKRVIVGLGVGVYILLFMVTPLPAFDRDINLPSQNASDPIWLYQASENDEIGWGDPQQSPRIGTGIDISVIKHSSIFYDIRFFGIIKICQATRSEYRTLMVFLNGTNEEYKTEQGEGPSCQQ